MILICQHSTDYNFYNILNYFKDNEIFYLGIFKHFGELYYLDSSWNHIRLFNVDNEKIYYL